jgi:signal transduction histidine kinase
MEGTGSGAHEATPHTTGGERSGADSFARYMEHVPVAFAVTCGAEHKLVYANAAFRRLTTSGHPAFGTPVADAFAGSDANELAAALDRALRTGIVARDRRVESADFGAPAWYCTVWPEVVETGEPAHLVVELRVATHAELTLALQRDVAERMLLSALRERDIARDAEAARARAVFLAAEDRRLAESLDEGTTLQAMTRLRLLHHGAWCIVDLLEGDGRMRRLTIIHSDPARQPLVNQLEGHWSPEPGDPFGLPEALRSGRPAVIIDDVDAALAAAAHDPETLRILQELGVGPLLTVPLVIREQLVGAITFVAGQRDFTYAREDVELAEDLAARSAMALQSARLHGEAIALRTEAEAASQAKSAFLGTMSHELRTPLNAISGYVELIDMGLRGPVTEAQHTDLARIRQNSQHLIALVTDVLNFIRVGSGGVLYNIADIVVHDVLTAGVALVEPLILQKPLDFDGVAGDATIVARADPERVTQILVNLLSNAVKFTPTGGRLAIGIEATEHGVLVRVADTGTGIPPDKLQTIFDPFVQVRHGLAGRDSGVGLGLAISRDLARGMAGDLTVESVVGGGSTFTLRLPIATPEGSSDGAAH